MRGKARLDATPYNPNKQHPIKSRDITCFVDKCAQCLRNHENTNDVSFFTSSWLNNNTLLHSTEANINTRNKRFYPHGRHLSSLMGQYSFKDALCVLPLYCVRFDNNVSGYNENRLYVRAACHPWNSMNDVCFLWGKQHTPHHITSIINKNIHYSFNFLFQQIINLNICSINIVQISL